MLGSFRTIADFTNEDSRRVGATYMTDVVFDRCSVRLMSNSERLVSRLADYYAPFQRRVSSPTICITALCDVPPRFPAEFSVLPPQRSHKKPKEEYADLGDGRVVRKLRTGMVFLFNKTSNIVIGECLRYTNQLINFINDRYMQWRLDRGGVLLHGAGVAFNTQGMAIAGGEGMGKSTLALELVERGFNYVSNNRLVVNSAFPGLRMYGLPRQPRVNPGTILHHPRLQQLIRLDRRQELQELSSNELWDVEEKYDVDVARLYGANRQRLLTRLSAIVVLRWDRSDAALSVRQVSLGERPDLLAAVIQPRGVFNLAGKALGDDDPPPRTYAETLRSCRAFEVSGGVSFKSLSDKLVGLFRPSRRGAGRM